MSSMQTRDKIVETARRLFYTRGFDNTSLGDLAAESGVPKGNFYYHFRSKDDVLRAVIKARCNDIERALASWAEDYPAPRTRLKRFVEMIVSERSDLVRYGCPTGSLLTEIGKKRNDLRPDVLSILNLYIDFAAGAFSDLGYPSNAARILAVRLVGRAQGAILIAHAYENLTMLDREIEDLQLWVDGLQQQEQVL